MPSEFGKSLQSVLKNIDYPQNIALDDNVPIKPYKFHQSFDYVTHPSIGLFIEELSEHQIKTWKLFNLSRRILEKTHEAES